MKLVTLLTLTTISLSVSKTKETTPAACLTNDRQYVNLTDLDGKKHHFKVFLLGAEISEFRSARNVVALDAETGDVHVKTNGDTIKVIQNIPTCASKSQNTVNF
jgi:hypothetical protein